MGGGEFITPPVPARRSRRDRIELPERDSGLRLDLTQVLPGLIDLPDFSTAGGYA